MAMPKGVDIQLIKQHRQRHELPTPYKCQEETAIPEGVSAQP